MAYQRKTAPSERPEAVRARIRRRVAKKTALEEEIGDHLELLGWKRVEDWDMEELARGRPRNKNGDFVGHAPAWVTPSIMAEARKRHKQLASDELAVYSSAAMKVMRQLMEDDETDIQGKPMTPASVKLEAAKYILNQTLGTPTARVELEGNIQLQGLLASVVINPDGQPAYPVLNAEIVEEDEDDDD